MSKISVIIPCYNASEYIVRCLEALENQSFKDFEVILIDDCSFDNTVKVIEDYISSSSMIIQLLKNAMNCGPAKSRNLGISYSYAEYICFCDSDDWYDKDYLDLIYSQAELNNSDLVFCGYKLIVEGKPTIKHPLSFPKKSNVEKSSILQMGIDSLCTLMVRRSIIAGISQPDIRNGEDMAIIPLLIVNSERFGFVYDCPYNYYCRSDSASMTPTISVVKSLIASFEFVMHNMPAGYEKETEFIGIKNLVYGGLLNLFKCGWNQVLAIEILNDFERDFPTWKYNVQISSLPLFKRLFVRAASHRRWCVVYLMSKIHSIIVK